MCIGRVLLSQTQAIGSKLYAIDLINASEEHPYLARFGIFHNKWVNGVIDFRNRRLSQYGMEGPRAMHSISSRKCFRIKCEHSDGRLGF